MRNRRSYALYNFSCIIFYRRPDNGLQSKPKHEAWIKVVKTSVVCDWFNTYAICYSICICIYIYICLCVCARVYIYIYIYIYIKISVTYVFTPWSRIVLEKLTDFQLVKKFPTLYWTRMFNPALTNACRLSLSWAKFLLGYRINLYGHKLPRFYLCRIEHCWSL